MTSTVAPAPTCTGDAVFVVNPMPANQTATSGFGSSSAPGAFADAVKAVKALVQNLPKPAPWRSMTDADGWHAPRSAEQTRAKLTHNASKFSINYVIIIGACALTSLLFKPLVACAVASAVAAAAWLVYDTKHVGVAVLRGATRAQRQAAAAALCAAVVLFSGAASVACTGALVGTIACAAHGTFYEAPIDFTG